MMSFGRLANLLVGPVAPLGLRAVPSGIDKQPVTGRVWLGREGLSGDAQGDRRRHGGPEKALHHYPSEHYVVWREELGDHALLTRPGAFGENLFTTGLTEADVSVGDVFRLGCATVRVSQGRQPCWKLSLRFSVSDMALRVQASGRTGWYYRVVEEGYVEVGNTLDLLDRSSPDWTIERLWHALYVDTMNMDELAAMAQLAYLPDNWRSLAAARIASGKVEDWTRRLFGELAV